MIDMIWEYYRDSKGLNSCLNCEFYYRHMSSHPVDVQHIMNVNNLTEYQFGQKMCVKHYEFVFMSWCCGDFLALPEHNKIF
jgi:hypothetical protein